MLLLLTLGRLYRPAEKPEEMETTEDGEHERNRRKKDKKLKLRED